MRTRSMMIGGAASAALLVASVYGATVAVAGRPQRVDCGLQ